MARSFFGRGEYTRLKKSAREFARCECRGLYSEHGMLSKILDTLEFFSSKWGQDSILISHHGIYAENVVKFFSLYNFSILNGEDFFVIKRGKGAI